MKKISISLFLILLCTGYLFAQKNKNTALEKYSEISYKIVMNGDAISSINTSSKRADIRGILKHLNTQQDRFPLYNTTFTYTGCSTIYDMTSNATPQNIIQDPTNPNRIHIVCMSSPPGDPSPGFPNRTTKYYFSSNKGQSWIFVSNIPGGRSGYPVITLMANGNELIANYSGSPSTTKYYYDAAPGLGSFTELYHTPQMDYIWPRIAVTNSLTNPVKLLSIVSPNGRDSCFLMKCLSLSPTPGTFTYQMINSDQAETYSIARGTDGKVGLIYKNENALFPNSYSSLFFMESTDNGVTFGSPLEIFHAQINIAGDSLGILRGLQITYQGNTPKVVFETARQTTQGTFYPNSGKCNIRFWSTNLPGVDPNRSIIIADTSNVGFHPYFTSGTANDALTNFCRPTIGTSADGMGLFVAFMVPSSNYLVGVDTASFMDVWFTYSLNYGLNWLTPSKITPESPIRDWTYPCLSPTSDNSSSYYYANILMLSDSVAGSYVNHSQNGESNAKYMFARVEIPRTLPSAPILMSPQNGSNNQPRNPNIKWYPVTGTASYRLQFALDLLFTTPIFDSANIIQTNLQLPLNFLSPGINIYWRVNATNYSGSGPWSTIWNFKTDTVPFYSVSGTVRYKDNNQPVSGGYVKAMKINTSTLNIITADSAIIQSYGTYVLPSVRKDADYYISPYPNSTPPNDNFVPTYYPSEILWERATPLNVNANLTNIDINVYRTMDTVGYNTIIGQVFNHNIPNSPLNDAIIFAKKDANFHRFSISNLYGQYALNNLLSANYKLFFNRLGFRSDSMIVTLINGQYLNSINYLMIPYYTGIEKNGNIIPTSYKLYQNYPNPFNPITKIKFDIPKISDVIVKVYDLTGREIAKLFNSKLQAGKYELTWNASQFSSGLYFIRIETNTFSDTKKMVLIK